MSVELDGGTLGSSPLGGGPLGGGPLGGMGSFGDKPGGVGTSPSGLGTAPSGLGDKPGALGNPPSALGDEPDNTGDNPKYFEGLKHLQAGEWQAAIRALEEAARQNPANAQIQRALSEARFKAQLDAKSHVRGRRWIIPWRAVAVRVLVVGAIAIAALFALQALRARVLPEVRAAQAAQQLSAALAEGKRYLEAADLPRAKAAFEKVLALDADNAEATAGLKQLEAEQKLADLYQQGVSAQEAGKTQVALGMYSDLLLQRSGYRDVAVRVAAIRQRATEDALFNRAESEYQAGRHAEAIQAYQQLQALNASYQRDTVAGRLFDSYMQLGRAMVAERPVALVELPQAREYFRQAAALKPRDTDAASQERLITVYLAGQAAYEARNWDEAARWYEAVFGQQKGYLDNIYVPQLYEAYVASGDSHAAAERWADAWNQYTKAIALPVPNKVLAEQRRAAVAFRITPTPTPTATPTATPMPTATAYIYVPPTALPSATPAAPLTTYRNQIVFKADKDGQSGFWVMNPDGSNRRYLGASGTLQKQYDDLIKREQLSPDGRCRVYTTQGEADKFPQIYIQCQGNLPGEVWTRQLTHLAGTTYDPVWAPDGSRIAFVSQEKGSDDLFVVNPDGTNIWNYTLNTWEWDKHPSFSPDSRKIVFWTNREGTKQIYMIDADGRNAKKIAGTTWDEYEPVWVK